MFHNKNFCSKHPTSKFHYLKRLSHTTKQIGKGKDNRTIDRYDDMFDAFNTGIELAKNVSSGLQKANNLLTSKTGVKLIDKLASKDSLSRPGFEGEQHMLLRDDNTGQMVRANYAGQ